MVTLVLMLVVMGVVQFWLWAQAQQVVIAAAQEAAAQASEASGTPEAAESRAQALLRGLQGMTDHREVSVEPRPGGVAVTVRATLRGILPGIKGLPLRATAVSHRERAP